jgi:uncharacterized protein YjcR
VTDWKKIETQYVAGDMSLRELARKKGISYSTLSKKASSGGWAAKRENFRDGVANEALARAQARGRERLETLIKGTEQLLDNAMSALEDNEQFKRYVVSEGCGEGVSETAEKIFEKYDTKAMKELTAVLKDLTGMIRDFYGIRTPAQELAEKLAAKRITQVEAQTRQVREQTAKLKRESEEQEDGREISVVLKDGEEAFME